MPDAMPPVRKELLPLLTEVWNQASSSGGDMEELFQKLSQAVLGATTEATQREGEYKAALSAPPAAVNPLKEALLRGMGNAASLFSGQPQGRQTAESMITGEQQALAQKQKDNLVALEGAYRRAADRAMRLGDAETELEFQTKLNANLARQEKVNKILLAGAEADIRDKQNAAEGAQRMKEIAATQSAEDKRQQAGFGQAIALQTMRDVSDQRQEYIRQGLDPTDPTKPLVGSRAYRTKIAPSMGFIDTKTYAAQYATLTQRTANGKPIFHGDKLRLRFLGIPPDQTYAADPDLWLANMLNQPDPDRPGKYLFPRDASNPAIPSKVYWKRITEYMQRYWPDWNPGVAATSAVGK